MNLFKFMALIVLVGLFMACFNSTNAELMGMVKGFLFGGASVFLWFLGDPVVIGEEE